MSSVYGADKRHHTLTVLVENKAGVLARVAGLFSRRGYNIFSLAVAPSDNERFSRITIVVDVESAPLDQIMKQLDKLIQLVGVFEGKIVDVGHDRLTVALEGAPTKLDDFEDLIRIYGIVEMQRTGRVALPKLDRSRDHGSLHLADGPTGHDTEKAG
jgi:acetolactate synthase-1/3 small subunit